MGFLGYVAICRKKEGTGGRVGQPRGTGARPGKGARPPPSRAGPPSPDLVPKIPERDFLQKYLSRRFHSVWTPFDIPFLQNPEIGKKEQSRLGLWVSRLVPKMI